MIDQKHSEILSEKTNLGISSAINNLNHILIQEAENKWVVCLKLANQVFKLIDKFYRYWTEYSQCKHRWL